MRLSELPPHGVAGRIEEGPHAGAWAWVETFVDAGSGRPSACVVHLPFDDHEIVGEVRFEDDATLTDDEDHYLDQVARAYGVTWRSDAEAIELAAQYYLRSSVRALDGLSITGAVGRISRTEYAGSYVVLSVVHPLGDSAPTGYLTRLPLPLEPMWFDGEVLESGELSLADAPGEVARLTRIFALVWETAPEVVGPIRARSYGLPVQSRWPLDWHQSGMVGTVTLPGPHEGVLVSVEVSAEDQAWGDIEVRVLLSVDEIEHPELPEGRWLSGQSYWWQFSDGEDIGPLNILTEVLGINWSTDPEYLERGRTL